jgi:hypothetical protein
MKRSALLTLCAVTLLLTASGCLQSSTLLKVNKDGSGTITVLEYYSPQITAMFESMSSMAVGMAEQMGGEVDAEETGPTDMFSDMIKQKTTGFGPDVKLVKEERRTNKKGWKGYRLTYAFDDINTVNLNLGSSDMGGPGMEAQSDDSPAFTFAFEPGETATLKIVPKETSATAEPAKEPGVEGEDAAMMQGSEEMDAMSAQMATQMMAPMMKGMRMSFFLQVDGEIVDTNAKYPAENRNDTIVIMDLPMDRVLENPEAMALITAEDPKVQSKLATLDIPGIKVEEQDKALSVSFK